MNYCLQHDCKYGYAIFSDAFKFRYDKFGSYRYNCKYLDVPRLGQEILNRHFPNLLESAQNNSLKLRRAMLTATKQWFTLPVLISCYCFVCTQMQANSGSVYS